MDAGTIIFYLIIIVFIITRIRRAIKEGEKSSPEKPRSEPAWKKALKDVMTEIQAGMETVAEREKTVSSGPQDGWSDIAVPAEYLSVAPEESRVPKRASFRPENPRERKPSEKMTEIRQMIDERRACQSGIRTPAAVSGMPDKWAARGACNSLPWLPDQLQAAVVWSEILAPPLALREFDR